MWSEQWRNIRVDIDQGWVSCHNLRATPKLTPDKSASIMMLNPEDIEGMVDSAGNEIWQGAQNKLGRLERGECYGYAPLPSIGMGTSLDTVKKGRALEYMAIAVQMGGLTLIDWEGYTMVNVHKIGSN